MGAETRTGTRAHGGVSKMRREQRAEEETSVQVTDGLVKTCNLHENSLTARFSSLTRC